MAGHIDKKKIVQSESAEVGPPDQEFVTRLHALLWFSCKFCWLSVLALANFENEDLRGLQGIRTEISMSVLSHSVVSY